MAQKGMDISTIEDCLNVLKQGETALDDLTAEVSSLQGPMQDCWTGIEADACIDFLNQLATKMQSMSETVTQVDTWITDLKENYSETASAGASRYSGN